LPAVDIHQPVAKPLLKKPRRPAPKGLPRDQRIGDHHRSQRHEIFTLKLLYRKMLAPVDSWQNFGWSEGNHGVGSVREADGVRAILARLLDADDPKTIRFFVA